MERFYDELSKSLAASVPRRESLRRMGAVFATAVLSPLGLGTACAATRDPCKAFCRCSSKSRQNACLAACRACSSDPSRLCGSCASGYVCTDLANDFDNCGACGALCDAPGPYEYGACVDGQCFYTCAEGAVDCGDYCADLGNDFDNCGGCGAPCDDPAPYEYGACVEGACVYRCVEGAIDCGDACTFLDSDPNNCGACGNACAELTPFCNQGTCSENAPCPPGGTLCAGHCTNLNFDNANCGACGVVCDDGWSCQGVCQPIDY